MSATTAGSVASERGGEIEVDADVVAAGAHHPPLVAEQADALGGVSGGVRVASARTASGAYSVK